TRKPIGALLPLRLWARLHLEQHHHHHHDGLDRLIRATTTTTATTLAPQTPTLPPRQAGQRIIHVFLIIDQLVPRPQSHQCPQQHAHLLL
ncbi:hypothetical protein OC844_007778, partial [Tilletia horrida]